MSQRHYEALGDLILPHIHERLTSLRMRRIDIPVAESDSPEHDSLEHGERPRQAAGTVAGAGGAGAGECDTALAATPGPEPKPDAEHAHAAGSVPASKADEPPPLKADEPPPADTADHGSDAVPAKKPGDDSVLTPSGAAAKAGTSYVFGSHDLETNEDTVLVLLQGSGAVRYVAHS